MRINYNSYSPGDTQLFAFPSELSSIDSLEILLNELKEQLAMTESIYSSVWIALNEAISNAIIHGNKCDAKKKVELSIEFKWNNCICFTITDEGEGFDHEDMPDPTDPQNIEKPYGRGVYLIRKLADLTIFTNKGSRVFLYFDLNKSGQFNS
jgi:serine/threonine-protein kinase RsbW